MRSALLTLTFALAAAGPAPLSAAPLKEASLTRIINDVRVLDPAGAQRPASLSETVRDRQAVVTGVQSRAELLFPDKTLTRLGASTVFTFKEGTRAMDLQRGTMLLQVPKGAGGAQIKTAAVTAAITGTTLLVEYSPGSGSTEAVTFPGLASTPSSAPVPAPVPVSLGERAVASSISGSVKVLTPGESTFRPLQPGESIPPGSSLMTGESGTATLSPVPGTALRVLPNTTLRVDESTAAGAAPRVRLDLKEGGVINMISHQNYQQVDYQVATPQGVCAARGTVFGLFVIGGRVFAIGAHGAAAFNGQPIGPGKAFGFGSSGGPLQPGSAQFQNLLNQVLISLSQAAGQGMIPGTLLGQVQQQLLAAGIPLSPGQQQLLTPPPAPQTAGNPANQGKGFAKVVVIEGEVRVFITGKPGESMLLGPGQMILFAPNTSRLPNPVDFDLETLLKTSKLIQDMEEGGQFADNAGSLDNEQILLALQKQQQELFQQILGGTNLFIFDGNEVVQLDDDNILILQQLIDSLGGTLPGQEGTGGGTTVFPPGTTGPLTTITGFPGLGAGTTVATNPTITDAGGTVLAEGKIMTGDPATDGTASPAEYLFGRPANAFDTYIDFDGSITAPFAAFRFDALTIADAFPIDTSAPGAQQALALVAEGNILVSLPNPLDLSPLAGGLLLASANGDISHNTGTVSLAGADLVYYASNGSVTVGTGGTFNGPGSLILGAGSNASFSGTANALATFELFAGNQIDFNGTVLADYADLSTEDGFGTGIMNLTGGSISAQTVNLSATTLNLGATAFAPNGPQVSAYISADNLNLLQDQSYGTNINVFFDIRDGAINGGGHSISSARGFTAISTTFSGIQNLSVLGGDIQVANTDLLVSGDLSASAAFNPGSGRISVLNGSIGNTANAVNSITADGDITADNIYAGYLVQALGATSSINAGTGLISFSSESSSLFASGSITAGRITGDLYQIRTSSLNLSDTDEASLYAQFIQADFIDAAGTSINSFSLSPFSMAPANASIRARSLNVNGPINYANTSYGGNGTSLSIELSSGFYFGGESGITSVNTSGGPGVGASGGKGGDLSILATEFYIQYTPSGDIRASGGFTETDGARGGDGGRIRFQAGAGGISLVGNDNSLSEMPNDYVNIEAVGGFATEGSGASSGNGGTIELFAPQNDILIETSTLLTETRYSDIAGAEKVGGTIDLRAGGPDHETSEAGPSIHISNSLLYATGPQGGPEVSTRGGRITLQSLRSFITPTAAILINNSSELRAITDAAAPPDRAIMEIQTGDNSYAKSANGFIQIGDDSGSGATLLADILRIQALNPSGGIKIYAGTSITARDQALLYAGSLTNGGSVQFLGDGTVNITTPSFLARAGTIEVSNTTTVNLNAANIGLYADNRNWNSSQTSGAYGDFLIGGTAPVPNTVQVNEVINGATVNVNTRNAPGAPASIPAPIPPGL